MYSRFKHTKSTAWTAVWRTALLILLTTNVVPIYAQDSEDNSQNKMEIDAILDKIAKSDRKLDKISSVVNKILRKLDGMEQRSLLPTGAQVLESSDRFQELEKNVKGQGAKSTSNRIWGVLDLETGIVWERAPVKVTNQWSKALIHCYNKTIVGGRKGWRLPTIEELASLVDPAQTTPSLPGGHPFKNVGSAGYWSATTVDAIPTQAWIMHFGAGNVHGIPKDSKQFIWCVRGGQGYDGP